MIMEGKKFHNLSNVSWQNYTRKLGGVVQDLRVRELINVADWSRNEGPKTRCTKEGISAQG